MNLSVLIKDKDNIILSNAKIIEKTAGYGKYYKLLYYNKRETKYNTYY